jgi:indolepyruvate ferredoxin oxidoreductase
MHDCRPVLSALRRQEVGACPSPVTGPDGPFDVEDCASMVMHDAPAGAPHEYSLDDRYVRDDGRVFLSGVQALARLPFEQLRIDRANGLRTAAYVSGYPGSPLAGYDREITRVAALAAAAGHTLVAQPGLNEELAATAVMGSQLTATLDSCRFDGVVGVWYGKAPGLDRASDALRHAVFAGTHHLGGAVALVGDDPSAKSSTLPSASGATLVDLNMPMLFPGDVQEAVDLGRHAIALSRASGLWTAIKIVESVADGTGTVDLHPERVVPIIPTMEVDGTRFVPTPSGSLITPYTLQLEREFQHVRLELARRYSVENKLNSVSVRGPHDWLGVVAAGSTYRELREAFALLGLRTDDDLRHVGVRLLRLHLPLPLDRDLVREFATDLAEIVVVEEKNPAVEWLVLEALYAAADRPIVVGKHAPDGSTFVPPTGALDADVLAPLLRARLLQRVAPERLAPLRTDRPARQLIPLSVNRTPFFCSGCPHNTSTRIDEHTLVGGGIGCHSMVMLMDPGRHGHIVGLTAMGNEGAQWFGMAPFVDDPHLVQNIGDGTLFHSGMLAVRAAVANGANITYKVLYNGAVAMTGGQDPFGQLTVAQLATVFRAEGVARVIVTTDDVSRYHDVAMPTEVDVWDRSRLDDAHRELAAIPGTTVLIHDQRCAAELRRDRKRGIIETPPWRVVIDERVCEGCGDCGDVSNCLSVQPVDTPFGRKTRIDQASCNLDASCLRGDCPSFLTVTPTKRAKRKQRTPRRTIDTSTLSTPRPSVTADGCVVRMSGIGGTGVVTVSQIIGTAAMLDGLQVRGLDQTGLSQKAGPVVSDLRFTRDEPTGSNRATIGSVDVLLAFDLLVAASDTHLRGASADRTVAVVSSSAVATGSMVVHPERAFPATEALERLRSTTQRVEITDSIAGSTAAVGDATMANVHLVGVAVQLGVLPLRPDNVERAIELNGVAVDKNLTAFRAGRLDAATMTVVAAASEAPAAPQRETLDDLVTRLHDDLVDYQSPRYAARFDDVVARVRAHGDDDLTRTVATQLHRLLAYKDEYEVARLMLLPESRARAEAVGGEGARIEWNLHPPVLRALGMQRKIKLRRTARPMFRLLRASRRLRGTPVDVFGWARLRRTERRLAAEYVDVADELLAAAARGHDPVALHRIAALPDQVRGYEHLKQRRIDDYRAALDTELTALRAALAERVSP